MEGIALNPMVYMHGNACINHADTQQSAEVTINM